MAGKEQKTLDINNPQHALQFLGLFIESDDITLTGKAFKMFHSAMYSLNNALIKMAGLEEQVKKHQLQLKSFESVEAETVEVAKSKSSLKKI